MENIIEINNVKLNVKEFKNERLVTFKDIDRVHEKSDGVARRTFNRYKTHFIEGEDYYLLTRENPMSLSDSLNIPPKGITLLTESGYYLIAKVFIDDLAWKVQKALINGYFRSKEKENFLTVKDLERILDERLSNKNVLLPPKYTNWKKKTFNKLRLLTDYLNENTDDFYELKDTMHLIFDEFDMDIGEYEYMYRNTYNIPSDIRLYDLDIIAHYKELRENYTYILDSICQKLNITVKKHKNIFDELAAKHEENK